ncbi:hypothetical protein [Labedaea rhizosphaerae]|uniref:Uncharacterized protein n=1 Tax=Labedaea rhizosphaerae TaxID=598644 RepID=A0A4R6SHP8_LABRH|nr:hypothetical protein [Labedaea rhizosphaerae]TDQ00468.1 hypothetical protein EV186_102329 [Labedaea rhizosphaerae]
MKKKIGSIIAGIVACLCLTALATPSSVTVADSTWDCHNGKGSGSPTP